jgi:adenosyl cobinamide kinase/adenosyl cobinamide phosphate guanylyltransferase
MEVSKLDRLTLVLGGARSGKSGHAEGVVMRHPAPWTYVATAQAFDDEMRARIAAHRASRAVGWETIEAPLDLVRALQVPGPALVDCLTLWLTNVMLGGGAVDDAVGRLLEALRDRAAPTVLVSNEVGLGIVPDNALARAFRDAAGVLHQRVAGMADRVVLMVAGIAMVVK